MFRPLGIRLAEFAALGVLLGTAFSLLAMPHPAVAFSPACSPAGTCSSALASPPPRPAPAATILDVAAGVSPLTLVSLVRLAPGEHVTAIDDTPVTGDLDAGTRLAQRTPFPNRYIDLDVRGPSGPRRILVLLH